MITEDYVSFETAKLLKEKGFDEYCPLWYNLDKPLEGPFFYKEIGWYGHNSYDYNGKRIVSAPTLQMAMKWLREVHKVHISIYPFNRELPVTDEFYYTCDIATSKLSSKEGHLRGVWKTYEEATEAALKYCLENLI